MRITPSDRVQSIGPYAFAEVDREVEKLRRAGIEPIDFGVGDPTIPTPEIVRNATIEGIEKRKSSGYPSYIGARKYREAVAEWTERRFGVRLDPETEIASTIGSKEAVFNFSEGFVNPGDYVIVPTPGYPPLARGVLFSEGRSYFVPLLKENGFMPDLGSIPQEVLGRAKIMWINYPNSPSGAIAPKDFLEKIVEFGHRHNIIIASDEAYIELYFDEKPHSILEITKEGVAAFHSLSKRSAMTCYRIGWVAGDRRVIDVFKKVKTNIDSGTPTFVQDGAIAALWDEEHVEGMRKDYRTKRDIMVESLVDAGLPNCSPQATIYIWQEIPEGVTSVEFATTMLSPEVAIVTTPGSWISDSTEDGLNPGDRYVRFALVPSVEKTVEAAGKIRNLML